MTKRFNFFFAICSAVLVLSSTANAQLADGDAVAIDFGTIATNTGSPGLANFNDFNPNDDTDGTNTLIADLNRLSDGGSSGVGLLVEGIVAVDDGFSSGTASQSPSTDTSVFSDVIQSGSGGSLILTFSGLNDGLLYDVLGGFNIASTSSIYNQDFIVQGTTVETTRAASFRTFTNGYVNAGDGVGFATNGSGEIIIEFADVSTGANSLATVSQLQLTANGVNPNAVPEPSSLAVLGMGVVGLIARRRRSV